MMTCGAGSNFRNRESASMPFIFGMRKSSRITSAEHRSSTVKASSALAAAPGNFRPGCLPSMLLRPARTTGWSSTISRRIGVFVDRFSMKSTLPEEVPDGCGPKLEYQLSRDWRNCLYNGTLARRTANLQVCGNAVRALSHPANSETRRIRVHQKTLTIIFDEQL